MDDREQIREFISRHVRGKELADNEDVFASGFVNSMFAMQLVQFVESAFGIVCESDDLDIDNFRSVDALAAFVERKRGAGVA
ncbi:acyl carrier protein [Longimicrobium terrae]|uniref:Acyl carrier protein n=1 Tax=Longimicrobium terrae TaxID=1639882 RepID=A0A841H1P9_9BACT|nr:phosphopantetheine-binding protein [Longimicrobium terrae]MBB4637658.1 acyl carrier protein [Longimicrobium terrae]MBB6072055.1 acyl carrier protein [Longimicrobium terrae]NNC29861.1 acyl carrier protein [Longimicrobium terrae]